MFTIIIHYLHLFGRSLGNATKGFLQRGEFPQYPKRLTLKSCLGLPPIHRSNSLRRTVKIEIYPLITVKSTAYFSPGDPQAFCLFQSIVDPCMNFSNHWQWHTFCVQYILICLSYFIPRCLQKHSADVQNIMRPLWILKSTSSKDGGYSYCTTCPLLS